MRSDPHARVDREVGGMAITSTLVFKCVPAATPADGTRLIPTEERFSGRRPGSCWVASATVQGQEKDRESSRDFSSTSSDRSERPP
jgi:hypothetical protein